MLTANINPAAERELAALSEVLARYHSVSKRDVADTLARKINDVRIQLFRGFWDHRYKGPRKGAKDSEGVAFRDMRRRAADGRGIRMRVAAPSASAPTEYYQRRKLRGAHGSLRRLRVPVRTSIYQRRVWTELARRQAGIGVLGVSFLLERYRKRFSTTQGAYVSTGSARLRANRTARATLEVEEQRGFKNGLLGRMTTAPTFARIEGFLPGQVDVGERYSILAIALADVRTDTEAYLKRKTEESLKATLTEAGVTTK